MTTPIEKALTQRPNVLSVSGLVAHIACHTITCCTILRKYTYAQSQPNTLCTWLYILIISKKFLGVPLALTPLGG